MQYYSCDGCVILYEVNWRPQDGKPLRGHKTNTRIAKDKSNNSNMQSALALAFALLAAAAGAERHLEGLPSSANQLQTSTEIPMDNSTTQDTNNNNSREEGNKTELVDNNNGEEKLVKDDRDAADLCYERMLEDLDPEGKKQVLLAREYRPVIMAGVALVGLQCILCSGLCLALILRKGSNSAGSERGIGKKDPPSPPPPVPGQTNQSQPQSGGATGDEV